MRLPLLLGRYFGSKWRNAPHYPAPTCDLIVEHFAGGAGYALSHAEKQVVLVEKNPMIAEIWAWLISVPPELILALPIHEPGELIPPEVQGPARNWVGFWNTVSTTRPNQRMSPSAGKVYATGGGKSAGTLRTSFWSEEIRRRSADTVQQIRHWRIYCASYEQFPPMRATHFVDPPYVGKDFYGQGKIDFPALGRHCLGLQGQIIVCENEGADWLPFWPFRDSHAAPRKGTGKRSAEMICTWET